MTSIAVNGSKIDNNLVIDMTIIEAIEFLNKIALKSNSVITEIKLNDVECDQDELVSEKVASYEKINFMTKSKAVIAFECLTLCEQYISILSEYISATVVNYRNNKIVIANELFLKVIEITEIFTNLFLKIDLTLKNSFKEHYSKAPITSELEISLILVLKEIYKAKGTSDYIALCDLLEYELTDNLNSWKNIVIPNIRKIKDN